MGPHWEESPAQLKPTADKAWCEGINRVFLHQWTATRPEDGLPGFEFFAGTHFNRKVTWWPQAGAFLAYISRCQYLLQQGLFAADVCYYYGDNTPNQVEAKQVDPSLGPGYDYDVCNAEMLLTRMELRDGRILLPDGMSYRLLLLPDRWTMPGSFGGPIKKDKIWFFGSLRYSNVEVPIPRTSKNMYDLQGFIPGFEPFNNLIEGWQPYVKVTGKMGVNHDLEVVWQKDLTNGESSWEYFSDPINVYSNGGDMYMGKLTSVWGQRLTTTFIAGYNNKGSNTADTYSWSRFQGSGPEVDIFSGSAVSGGLRVGNNLIVQSGNRYSGRPRGGRRPTAFP